MKLILPLLFLAVILFILYRVMQRMAAMRNEQLSDASDSEENSVEQTAYPFLLEISRILCGDDPNAMKELTACVTDPLAYAQTSSHFRKYVEEELGEDWDSMVEEWQEESAMVGDSDSVRRDAVEEILYRHHALGAIDWKASVDDVLFILQPLVNQKASGIVLDSLWKDGKNCPRQAVSVLTSDVLHELSEPLLARGLALGNLDLNGDSYWPFVIPVEQKDKLLALAPKQGDFRVDFDFAPEEEI
ncbi:MAG: hypothetical protein LBL69_01600 [Zoogloeaceae bacterium]|nr:hypothetical protein [Zoogloeaceae bacterium]